MSMLVTYVEMKMARSSRLQQRFLRSCSISAASGRLTLLTLKATERRQWRSQVMMGPMMTGIMIASRRLASPKPDHGESLTEQGMSTS